MGVSYVWLVAAAVAVACAGAQREGSSLRGALEALQRRQRGRVRPPLQPDYDVLYDVAPPQAYADDDYEAEIEDLENKLPHQYLAKLLERNERPMQQYEYKIIKKKTPNKKESAFRERSHLTENDRLKNLFADKEDSQDETVNYRRAENDAEYAMMLQQLWSKYKSNKHSEASPPGVVKLYKEKVVKKRYPDNWGPIAFKKKRSSGPEPELPSLAEYEEGQGSENIEPKYNGLNIPDVKDDIEEEYAIAFQPLDDDSPIDLDEDDQYSYDLVEKRFPVSKRSIGPYYHRKRSVQDRKKIAAARKSSSGTDPKTIKHLSKIFGEPDFEVIKSPVKRSSDDGAHEHDIKPPAVILHQNHTHEHNNSQPVVVHEEHGHIHHPGTTGKEIENPHDHDHHDHHHETNHSEKSKPITVRKKSIDWSDYFGIDKRLKKTVSSINGLNQDTLSKQYFDTFNREVMYPVNSFRRPNYVKRNFQDTKPNEEQDQASNEKRNSRNVNDAKLDNIDKKLKNMEGMIVDEALQYSQSGDQLDSKEEQEMKEKLLSRLAAAYSLEKMRKALKEFKQSLKIQKTDSSSVVIDESKSKRVAVKKESVDMHAIPLFNNAIDKADEFEDEQGAGHFLDGKNQDQFSEGYMGGSGRHRVPVMSTAGTGDSCPVLAKIVQRCRSVDLLAGDRGQLFLPLCSLHQICYLCGEAPPTTCDLVFLSEADTGCDGDMVCQRAARSALMVLRELHDSLADELDGECEASPCLPATLRLNHGWQRALQR